MWLVAVHQPANENRPERAADLVHRIDDSGSSTGLGRADLGDGADLAGDADADDADAEDDQAREQLGAIAARGIGLRE